MSKPNPLRKWRSVAQLAKECQVSPQAIRDAIKAGKIEAWPVGEYLLIHKDQAALFEKTRIRKLRQIGDGKFKLEVLPARGRRRRTAAPSVLKPVADGQST